MMLRRENFENDEVFKQCCELIKKYNVLHLNIKDDAILTFDDVNSLRGTLENIKTEQDNK